MSAERLAGGELAAVVTYLEMRARPGGEVPPSTLCLEQIAEPSLDTYRSLFRQVGAPWLWFSRLVMPDPELAAILADPDVAVFAALDGNGATVGMLELDWRSPKQCELAFVGLVPGLTGQGHGRWLIAEATSRAWRDGVERVHVHTCTLDHPAALNAYLRAGFTAVGRGIERFPDPRLSGILPRDCAPRVPLVEP